MQEQKLETSDESMPTWRVEKHNSTQNRIRFKNNIASIGDEVTILKSEQHTKMLQRINDADKYLAKINKLEYEINDADIRTLKKDNEDLKRQIKNKNNSINTYKTNSVKNKAKLEDLQTKIDKLTNSKDKFQSTIQEQYKTISDKNATIKNLKETIKQQEQTLSELKEMNDSIAKQKDKLEKQLDNTADASEIKKLQQKITTLKDELTGAKQDATYWQSSYENMVNSSDELAIKNESLIAENNKLRNDNNAINETNKLLNENLIASNNTFNETKQELQLDFENKEKELKETIKKQQSHIDELTDKYQSLLPLQDNMKQSTHYKEIDALKDKLNEVRNELNKTKAGIETKLAVQKQELTIAHKDEIHTLQETHTDEKAQLLIAYTNDLNNGKIKYNNLAMEYNQLLSDASSLTKINTLFSSRHKEIIKGKKPMELLTIPAEQLPQSDEIEMQKYVPKD